MSHTSDLVITGAKVWCGDSAQTVAEAVGVRDGRIVAVGTEDEVRDQVGSAVDALHLPGRLLVAGFQDSHIHPGDAGKNLRSVALNDLDGRDAYLEAIGGYAREHPERAWITGGGWAMEHFPGGTPTKEDLDSVIPDRPVFLYNRDVHGAWVNSRALELAGIDKDTPDPDDGRIERHPVTGEPSGALQEGAAYSLYDRLVPQPDQAEWEASHLHAQAHLHALGITAWQDAWVSPAIEAAYVSLAESGLLTARVVGSLWWERADGLDQIPSLLARREASAPRGGDRFHPTTVKIMVDGVLENFTGAMIEPYCDGCGGQRDGSGLDFVEREELAAAVTALDAHGFQVHMHAIGDRAVRNALDAVAAARAANGASDGRHSIAHIQVMRRADVARFAELGVVANCQPYWAHDEPQMAELTIPFLGPERAELQYLFGDLLRSGARLSMGSDWPVTTADPLHEIEVAVTRVAPYDRSRAPFLPEQRLSLVDALAAFTSGSAYVNHDDVDSGTIEVGKRADLAVIDRDLFAPDAGPIADASVELTVAAGRVVFSKG